MSASPKPGPTFADHLNSGSRVLPTYVVGNSGRLRLGPCAFWRTVGVPDFEFADQKWGRLPPFQFVFRLQGASTACRQPMQ